MAETAGRDDRLPVACKWRRHARILYETRQTRRSGGAWRLFRPAVAFPLGICGKRRAFSAGYGAFRRVPAGRIAGTIVGGWEIDVRAQGHEWHCLERKRTPLLTSGEEEDHHARIYDPDRWLVIHRVSTMARRTAVR